MNNKLQIVVLTMGTEERRDIRKLQQKKLQVLLEASTFNIPTFNINYEEYIRDTIINIVEKMLGVTKIYVQQLYTWGDPKYYTEDQQLSITYLVIINKKDVKRLENKYDFYDIYIEELSNTEEVKTQNVELKNKKEKIKYIIKTRRKNHDGNMEYIYYLEGNKKYYEMNAIILHRAMKTLRNRIESTNIVFNFIDKEFTLTELQQMYELILRKELIKGNFRKKIAQMVIKTDNVEKDSGYRPSQKFKFNQDWITDWV